MSTINCVYRRARSRLPNFMHLRTGGLYRLIGHGRYTDHAGIAAIYVSTADATRRETGETLPKGTIWIRPYPEFNNKFRRIGRKEARNLQNAKHKN